MNVPNYPQSKIVNSDGSITDDWKLFFDQLITQSQSNLSNEGFVPPSQPTTNISQIEPGAQNGTLLYDDTTHELKTNINGTFKVIQTV